MPAALPLLFFLTTFLAVGLALLAGVTALERFQARAAAPPPEEAPDGSKPEASRILRDESLSTISAWGKFLEHFDFVDLMNRQIAQADLDWSVGRVTLSMLLSGLLALVFLVRGGWLPGWMNGALAYAAALAPYLYIWNRRKKRFAKFEAQFPDALDSVARALRAGHPFAAALDMVANECEAPVSTELHRASAEGNFGMSWNVALDNLSSRVPILEVNMFAAAVQLQTRTGGRLSEVLGILAEGMRESSALKGEVRAIAAHGRMTGIILTVLPPVIALIMAFVNPSYLQVLITDEHGKYLIAGAVVCLALAQLVIRRIVDIKV